MLSYTAAPESEAIDAQGLQIALIEAANHYPILPIYVTEITLNEDAQPDVLRPAYIVQAFQAVQQAMGQDGIQVKGVFYRSLVDAFEWQDGFAPRTGLFLVDFTDPTRPRTEDAGARPPLGRWRRRWGSPTPSRPSGCRSSFPAFGEVGEGVAVASPPLSVTATSRLPLAYCSLAFCRFPRVRRSSRALRALAARTTLCSEVSGLLGCDDGDPRHLLERRVVAAEEGHQRVGEAEVLGVEGLHLTGQLRPRRLGGGQRVAERLEGREDLADLVLELAPVEQLAAHLDAGALRDCRILHLRQELRQLLLQPTRVRRSRRRPAGRAASGLAVVLTATLSTADCLRSRSSSVVPPFPSAAFLALYIEMGYTEELFVDRQSQERSQGLPQ